MLPVPESPSNITNSYESPQLHEELGAGESATALNKKSAFSANCNDFKLPHSPSASSSSSMESATMFEHPSYTSSGTSRRSTPYTGSRRPSTLHCEVMTMDEDEDYDVLESPFYDEECRSMPAPPPFSTPARTISPTSAAFPRSASFAPHVMPIRHVTPEEPLIGMRPPVKTSFNPLNPSGIRQAEQKMDAAIDEPTFDAPSRSTSILQRAKSSPMLRGRSGETPATPRSYRMDPIANEAETTSFQGLGMSLPDQESLPSNDQVSSPPPKGPVRRAVARRGSLFPKVKAYLRVAASLQDEASSHPDVDEISSEAALHKLASSRPFSDFAKLKGFSGSTSGDNNLRPIGNQSIKNRFPEAALTEDEEALMMRHSSSDSDEADMSENNAEEFDQSGSGPGSRLGMSGPNTSGDSETWKKDKEVWSNFREHRGSPGSASGFGSRYAASLTGGMELDSPSGGISARPGKRKAMDSDRNYEYQTFKRRAVSPSASSTLGSPVLGSEAAMSTTSHSYQHTQPNSISVHPPPNTQSFFASLNNSSRASSPVHSGAAKAPAAPSFNLYASGSAAVLGSMLSHRSSMGGLGDDEDIAPIDQMKL